ncbi:MAG: U32 family peptidase [Nanoarchaeota archaeon]|nr:U32 family peptidase [Nanoarchaeota archaeon]
MKKIELLAPAGDFETLKTAIDYGADAVYIGGKKFGARAFANNFSLVEIKKAVEYAHVFNSKVYVTVNTLIKNNEMRYAVDYVNELYRMNVDAVIVQDYALAKIIKDNFPKIEVHASTQTSIHNSDTILFADQFDRFILARELSRDQIGRIIQITKKPVEVFVHGALCFSVSGQCLMSSIIGGRSGNRGRCAQPCRKAYNITDENAPYMMSTADLCLVNNIPKLIELGVHSLKIEGRMKSTDYVGTVVAIYRRAIDRYYEGKFFVKQEEEKKLFYAFNRTFTKGFFNNSESIVAPEKPGNRSPLMPDLKNDEDLKKRKNSFSVDISVQKGEKIKLKAEIEKHSIKLFSKNPVEKAAKKPISEEDINNILNKTKNTPFEMKKFSCRIDDDAFVPFSELTRIKEELIASMSELLCKREERPEVKAVLPNIIHSEKRTEPKLFVKIYDPEGIKAAAEAGADILYYNIFNKDLDKAVELSKSISASLFFEVPSITYDEQIPDILKTIKRYKPEGLLLGNPALLNHRLEQVIHLNFSFNTFSDYDINYWKHLPILSLELNQDELIRFKNKDAILFVHGNLVVMSTKSQISANKLTDRKNHCFPVRKNPAGYTEILNSITLGFFNEIKKLQRAGYNRFCLDLDTNVFETVSIYKKIMSGERYDDSQIKKEFTRGHLKRGVE